MDFSMEYTREQEEFAKEVGAWLDENLPLFAEEFET